MTKKLCFHTMVLSCEMLVWCIVIAICYLPNLLICKNCLYQNRIFLHNFQEHIKVYCQLFFLHNIKNNLTTVGLLGKITKNRNIINKKRFYKISNFTTVSDQVIHTRNTSVGNFSFLSELIKMCTTVQFCTIYKKSAHQYFTLDLFFYVHCIVKGKMKTNVSTAYQRLWKRFIQLADKYVRNIATSQVEFNSRY